MKEMAMNKAMEIVMGAKKFALFVLKITADMMIAAAVYAGIDDMWLPYIGNEWVEFGIQMIILAVTMEFVDLAIKGWKASKE